MPTMSKTALNYYSDLIKSLKYKYRGKIENRNRNKKKVWRKTWHYSLGRLTFFSGQFYIFPIFDS
jgi:hypothetical protein